MNKSIKFIDKEVNVLFIDNQSLADYLGDDFNKLIDKYYAKQDERIFRKEPTDLLDYFDKESYDFSDLSLDDVINDLSLSKNNPFVKEYANKPFNIRWMTLEDNETGYIYFLIDPKQSIYAGVEQYLTLGDYYRFAFSNDGNDYLVIMLKLK